MPAPFAIRTFGDPVLKRPSNEITEIDATTVRLADDMIATMYDAGGVGLAGPQVGVQKRIFVYDAGDGPATVLNPRIVESRGEWTSDEGCLSVPGLYFSITRPRFVVLEGTDLDGKPITFEAEDFLGRIFLHELDHLDGKLLLDRLDPDQRKQAMRDLRDRQMRAGG